MIPKWRDRWDSLAALVLNLTLPFSKPRARSRLFTKNFFGAVANDHSAKVRCSTGFNFLDSKRSVGDKADIWANVCAEYACN